MENIKIFDRQFVFHSIISLKIDDKSIFDRNEREREKQNKKLTDWRLFTRIMCAYVFNLLFDLRFAKQIELTKTEAALLGRGRDGEERQSTIKSEEQACRKYKRRQMAIRAEKSK